MMGTLSLWSHKIELIRHNSKQPPSLEYFCFRKDDLVTWHHIGYPMDFGGFAQLFFVYSNNRPMNNNSNSDSHKRKKNYRFSSIYYA